MKSTIVFLGALFLLSCLASGAMLLTATMKPQWFMLGAKGAEADSLRAGTHAGSLASADSTKKNDTTQTGHDTQAPATGEQTSSNTAVGVPAENPVKAEKAAAPTVTAASIQDQAQTDAAKERDLQSVAKLYEAMKPDDAAKILSKQDDKEIRRIILHIKKKQAAKILSSFNADRAAQILAQ
ncbi:MAG TPA: hypothetical protein VK470_17535 [Bacteroidota bacterium]|nr:hypothetical protein [Bacteroidota bacterium]